MSNELLNVNKLENGIIPLRLAISGAGGFLGRNLIRCAVDEESVSEIIAITSDIDELKKEFGQCKKVSFVDSDVFLNRGGVYDFGRETVFVNSLFPTNADGYKMADGLSKVFKCISSAKSSGIGAVINISSQSVYESKRHAPAKESDKLCLESSYAVGKYSSEVYCNTVCGEIPHTNIRLSSLMGVGYDMRIVNRLIIQALNGEQLKIIGGMQRYGLLDVRDAACGILALVKSDWTKWKECYNLGRDDCITLAELVQLIVGIMAERGISVEYSRMDGIDDRNSSIDAKLFMREFSWQPQIDIRQSIDDILRHMMRIC